ncbi:hypothetical protein Hanom_Chr04g00326381 [Helianthus anomalus]
MHISSTGRAHNSCLKPKQEQLALQNPSRFSQQPWYLCCQKPFGCAPRSSGEVSRRENALLPCMRSVDLRPKFENSGKTLQI